MKIDVKGSAGELADAGLVVAGLFQDQTPDEAGLAALDQSVGGGLSRALAQGDFAGKSSDRLELYGTGEAGPSRVIVEGLGAQEDADPERVRRSLGRAGKRLRALSATEATLVLPLAGPKEDDAFRLGVAAVEGLCLGTYRYNRRSREEEKHAPLARLLLLHPDTASGELAEQVAETSTATVEGVFFARDLAATPGMDLTPELLAGRARELEGPELKVEILDATRLEALKMGGVLAVGAGSANPPVLIHLTYAPDDLPEGAPAIAVVGKGITFDAGGLDIKSKEGMRWMKYDMHGAATVLGLFKALPSWKPACRVEGFVAAAENLLGAAAYRPGDVLTSYKGLTIEVDNTDAEGRLTLADAMAYAVETVQPDAMVDVATLTGACMIALGEHASGLMGTDDELAERIERAGNTTGERVWRLPLWPEYSDQIRSEIADLKNTGGRPAGAITAAAFLKEFAGDVPWAHLDIAGTAMDVTSYSYVPHKELPSGVGVRLLLELLRSWA